MLVIIPGAVQLREASGNPDELINDFYLNCSFRACSEGLYHNENVKKNYNYQKIKKKLQNILCNNLMFIATIYIYIYHTGIFTCLTSNITLC